MHAYNFQYPIKINDIALKKTLISASNTLGGSFYVHRDERPQHNFFFTGISKIRKRMRNFIAEVWYLNKTKSTRQNYWS